MSTHEDSHPEPTRVKDVCGKCWSMARRDAIAEIDTLRAENGRLTKALAEQTEQVRRWRNKANNLRVRRSKMLRRLGYGVHEDDSVVAGGDE